VLQKIEIIDDEESDMISNSEVEQENSLLDYKVKRTSRKHVECLSFFCLIDWSSVLIFLRHLES
jgi:hypothetical protein